MIPDIKTNRLVLRGFRLEDAPRLQQLAGDARVAATTLNIPHPYPDGEAERWIGGHADDFENDRNAIWAVAAADELVGAVSLRIAREHQRAELGYWIGVPYWGQGYATEASHAVVTFGFRELALHRIDAHYLGNNPSSGRVMEKIGMKPEGTLRKHIVKLDVAQDVVLYGVLREEFE